MLRSLEGREVFREFLRSEYSEDNLLFWLACEDLKKETNATVVDEKARIIYEDYVSILSPKEVPTVFQSGCVFEEGLNYGSSPGSRWKQHKSGALLKNCQLMPNNQLIWMELTADVEFVAWQN